MSALQVYLLFKMDVIKGLLWISYFTLFFISTGYMMLIYDYYSADENFDITGKAKKLVKKLTITFSIIIIINAVLPSTKTLVLMYIIPKITQNKQIEQLPPLILKYIEHLLQQKINKN